MNQSSILKGGMRRFTRVLNLLFYDKAIRHLLFTQDRSSQLNKPFLIPGPEWQLSFVNELFFYQCFTLIEHTIEHFFFKRNIAITWCIWIMHYSFFMPVISNRWYGHNLWENIANSESLLIIIGSNIGRMLFSSIKK